MSITKKYTTAKIPGAFSGLSGFEKNNKFERAEIEKALQAEDAYTLHFPVKKRFPREKFMVFKIDNTWQIDLADVSNLKNKSLGQNFGFLFCAIDVLSRFAWVEPIKTKHSTETREALEKIFENTNRRPKNIYSDCGNEFKGEFAKYLKENSIHQEFTKSVHKASIAERFNRTIKEKMYRLFTKQGTKSYIKILQDLVDNYNHSFHRSLKRAPATVNDEKSEQEAVKALYGDLDSPLNSITFKFKLGDYVRIPVNKKIFTKGYLAGWTNDIYLISQQVPTNPPKYIIKDIVSLKEKPFYFYSQELQKVKKSEFPYDTLEILQEEGEQILVKKLNSSTQDEEWIPKKYKKTTARPPQEPLRRSSRNKESNKNA